MIGVKNTYTAKQLHENEYSNSFHSLIQRGFNQKKSGDVIVEFAKWLKLLISEQVEQHMVPIFIRYSCSFNNFFGGEIPQGKTDRKVNIRDIIPTISTILGISYPNGCTGNPLQK